MDRGLRGVKLIIADEHKGLKGAAAKVLDATIQRCRVHFMQNALACAGKKDSPLSQRRSGRPLSKTRCSVERTLGQFSRAILSSLN
ncbi:hypothetical protein E1B25_21770 [Antarcticimicrobium sediminis]|uniref:Mutator family transposase n=1 Tax=Antarcticimicrobium sediminis TaxID=2546227 RepID=A0A4R5EF34_9RHOB|nr:transposase [Antarcticimicrobium sediminis]TDE32969.1 hypothetical protein E1B25_21770 [Antarcticimicrobium sediminis]